MNWATKKDEACPCPMQPVEAMDNGWSGPPDSRIACAGCGAARKGTEEEVAAARRANVAWRAYERGEVHPDRGCDGCNRALPLERYRLCLWCVEAENAKLQGRLFPDLTRPSSP
jgi:hypothetical protein